MTHERDQSLARRFAPLIGVLSSFIMLAATARCAKSGPIPSVGSTTLRVGIGGLPQLTPQAGVQQFIGNLSTEGLVAPYEDGRPRPWLAESWSLAPNGLVLTVRLRPTAKFHDGTSVTASIVVQILQSVLPNLMGPTFQEDVEKIVALDDTQVQIQLRQPSRFLLEALEIAIRKPVGKTTLGTGPYEPEADSSSTLESNKNYYLGQPTIERIVAQTYPTVRTAWAELLRGNLDMLYEVNIDALDSLQRSSNVSVYSYLRHYQYVIMFGDRAPVFKAPSVRRELNAALDRNAIVRDVLSGHGIPSIGPVPPQHWALEKFAPRIGFNPTLAKSLAARRLRFTCLVAADSLYERIALAVKQQLAAASVDMQVQEVTQDQIIQAGRSRSYEALLIDVVSGPSMFRSFRHFYSKAPFDLKPVGNTALDKTLDRIRHASSDDEYKGGVTAFQQAIVDDPPEVFLVWAERARAVSRRFDVSEPEGGRDVLNTLRLWRPVTVQQLANRN
jgi:peptide/nickel transport system substrate-binding protein